MAMADTNDKQRRGWVNALNDRVESSFVSCHLGQQHSLAWRSAHLDD